MLLIFGGAYLLRAITDFQFVPTGIGIAMGATYAVYWLFMAWRKGLVDSERAGAAFFGGTSVLLALPLLVEAVTKFELLSGQQGLVALTVYFSLALWVAVLRQLRSLAWLVTIGGIGTAFAILIASHEAPLVAIVLVFLGLASPGQISTKDDKLNVRQCWIDGCPIVEVLDQGVAHHAPVKIPCAIRFGERKVLSLEYFSLIFIFVAYATSGSKLLVAVLYILDHIFFNFAIAIRTYFQKVGDPKDIAPSMAVGFTINHIAAVVIPVVFGLVWLWSPAVVFLCGTAMAGISLALSRLVPTTPEEGNEVRRRSRRVVAN